MQLRPMNYAPLNGTSVLLKFKDDLSIYSKDKEWIETWQSLFFVGKNHGGVMGWCFSAPVGHGGISSEWLQGWIDLKDIEL